MNRNKDEISADVSGDLLVFGAPREELEAREAEEFKKWLHGGGRAVLFLGSNSDGEHRHTMHSLLQE
jgi:hypothetical protein